MTIEAPRAGPPAGDRVSGRAGEVLRWFFRDRRTGRIVVGQFPNAPLWIFAAAAAIEALAQPAGGLGTAVRVVKVAALVAWAADEVLRGVNPWRRCLGAAVLAFLAVSAFA